MTNKRSYWIGCDVGGTKLLVALYDNGFKPIAQARKKNNAGDGGAAGLQRIGETIDNVLKDAGVAPRNVRGIGIGAAGFLDLEKGLILSAPNLGWRRVAVREKLRARFGRPVCLLNDVDAGTYGEYRLGAARGSRCVVGVFPGTGIGGACVYDGRLIRGKNMSAMEIGHICVEPGGSLCGCGRFGCLETVAGRLAIAAQIAMAAQRNDTPALRGLTGTDIASIRSGTIAKAMRAGDPAVTAILRNAARRIGIALTAPLHLLAPDTILLGGGMVEAMPAFFVREVGAALRANAVAAFARGVKVAAAVLGDDAVAMGAAVFAADQEKRKT